MATKETCHVTAFFSPCTLRTRKWCIVTPKTSRPDPTEREPPPVPERVFYLNFGDLSKDVTAVAPPWVVKENSATVYMIGLPSDSGWRIFVSLTTETGLIAHVKVSGFPVPHLAQNLEKKRLKSFLADLLQMTDCTGVTEPTLQEFAGPPDDKCKFFRHHQYLSADNKVKHTSCVRSVDCRYLLSPEQQNSCCTFCLSTDRQLQERKKRQEDRLLQPVKANDPLHNISQVHLKAAFKRERMEKQALQKKLTAFQRGLENSAVPVSADLHRDLLSVNSAKMDSLQKMFWDEQEKAFRSKNGAMRWHPMMLRLAILIHSKSPAAYDTLRKTGILKLPGSSTLREYTTVCESVRGFSEVVMDDLTKVADKLTDENKYVVLLHDEMSVKSDLVFDPRTGKLVGFANKDHWTFDIDCEEKFATQALVFFVVGISCDLKMSLGYFGTRGATSDELMPLLWTAIGAVEACGLKVIASTSDKASPNQRLYQLHQVPGEEGVCFKALNLFAPDRHVFFLSDPPHLIKTVRNNLEASGGRTRLLWNQGRYLLWQHVRDLYNADVQGQLRRTKLRHDHIFLTPHSKMNVRLAAQVLSQSVGRVMQEYGQDESRETAQLILHMDQFFDCLNSRHLFEADRTRKPDLLPYRNINDPRFDFLQTTFLGYLADWKASVEGRQDDNITYTKADRQKMFLSHQTFKGLVMTVHGFVGAARYLLGHGVKFILANKFCQDPLEEHFGRHRAMGRTADNPTLLQFGHQENSLRMQRQLALIVTPRGNVHGAPAQRPVVQISTSPLKKKQKKN